MPEPAPEERDNISPGRKPWVSGNLEVGARPMAEQQESARAAPLGVALKLISAAHPGLTPWANYISLLRK